MTDLARIKNFLHHLVDNSQQQHKQLSQEIQEQGKKHKKDWQTTTNQMLAIMGVTAAIILTVCGAMLSYAGSLYMDANSRLHDTARMKNGLLVDYNNALREVSGKKIGLFGQISHDIQELGQRLDTHRNTINEIQETTAALKKKNPARAPQKPRNSPTKKKKTQEETSSDFLETILGKQLQ